MAKLRPLWTPGGTRGATGSFTCAEVGADCNINGFGTGTAPAFTINWYKVGNIVGLSLAASGTYTGTSNATSFNITGIPADIRPTLVTITSQVFTGVDNNVGIVSRAQVTSTGNITFQRGSVSGTDLTFSTTGWLGSGTKGLSSSWQLIYLLA